MLIWASTLSFVHMPISTLNLSSGFFMQCLDRQNGKKWSNYAQILPTQHPRTTEKKACTFQYSWVLLILFQILVNSTILHFFSLFFAAHICTQLLMAIFCGRSLTVRVVKSSCRDPCPLQCLAYGIIWSKDHRKNRWLRANLICT